MVCRWDCKEASPQFIAGISYSLSKGERYARCAARATPRHPFFPTYLARPGSQPATLKKGLLPSFPPSSTPFHSISALLSLGCHPHPPSLLPLPLPLHCYSLTRPRRPNPPTDRPADRRPSGKSRGHRRLSRGGRFIIHGILIWSHPQTMSILNKGGGG